MKSIWQGSLGFGLVNIPVNLYTASRERTINFDYLRESDHCPIGYVKVCKNTGEEVPYNKIVRGYEYQKDEYAILTDEDFRRADVKKNELIEILDFVDAKEVDPASFIRPYYLEPDQGATKAYVLLRKALEKSGKAAIAKFVMREREYLAMIIPRGETLTLIEMRFESELAPATELAIPKEEKVSAQEMNMALDLIQNLSLPFNPAIYKDTYTEELKAIIKQKVAGVKLKPVAKQTTKPTKVKDLMAKLKESLNQDYLKHARYA